jgi:hypothetical protein
MPFDIDKLQPAVRNDPIEISDKLALCEHRKLFQLRTASHQMPDRLAVVGGVADGVMQDPLHSLALISEKLLARPAVPRRQFRQPAAHHRDIQGWLDGGTVGLSVFGSREHHSSPASEWLVE